MRALGRVVRSDEAANEVVAAGGLVPIVKLLDCNDPGVVRRYTLQMFFRMARDLGPLILHAVHSSFGLCHDSVAA